MDILNLRKIEFPRNILVNITLGAKSGPFVRTCTLICFAKTVLNHDCNDYILLWSSCFFFLLTFPKCSFLSFFANLFPVTEKHFQRLSKLQQVGFSLHYLPSLHVCSREEPHGVVRCITYFFFLVQLSSFVRYSWQCMKLSGGDADGTDELAGATASSPSLIHHFWATITVCSISMALTLIKGLFYWSSIVHH